MMKITGLSHLFKWENLHNWWLTKYFFAPLYLCLVRMPAWESHSFLDWGAFHCLCGGLALSWHWVLSRANP